MCALVSLSETGSAGQPGADAAPAAVDMEAAAARATAIPCTRTNTRSKTVQPMQRYNVTVSGTTSAIITFPPPASMATLANRQLQIHPGRTG